LKKKLIIAGSVIVVFFLIGVFVAGYFLGNVPIVSATMGTNKPKDLGVKISAENAYSGLNKMNNPTNAKELEALQKNPKSYTTVKTTLTQDEVSSIFASADIPDFPFRVTQIKLGNNGAYTASGILDTEKLQKYLKDLGVSGDIMNQVMGFVKNARYFTYYAEGNVSITNNRPTGEIKSIKLANIEIPRDILQNNKSSIQGFVTSSITKNGYNIRKLTISEGKADVDMDRPLGSEKTWLKFVQY
jgi:hypothetical protein